MFSTLKLFYHTLALAGNPIETKHVFAISETLLASTSSADIEKGIQQFVRINPDFQELFDSKNPKWLNTPYDLNKLKNFPAGSLGNTYANHMISRGFNPEFYPHHKINGLADFVFDRTLKTHDIWHVVSGFDTDVYGEIGLQGFYLGQDPGADAALIVTAGIIWAVKSRDAAKIQTMFQYITKGYQLGKRAKKLFAVRWEDMWEIQVKDLRLKYNIITPQEYALTLNA